MAESRDSRASNSRDEKLNVQTLLRKNLDDRQVLAELRNKYTDQDIVNKLFNEYEDKMELIRRKARKFANAILTKYSHLGTRKIMEKAKKLKKKYEFSDDEFQAFINNALSDKSLSNTYNVPNTPLSRTLGYNPDASVGKLLYNVTDMPVVQEILVLYQETNALHMQVVVQSILYKDCSPEAITGQYKADKDNAYAHIPSILAALFLPRIKYIDEHMLIANISRIVANKYNNIAIKTQPDYELFYDMITDPNEVACSSAKDNQFIDLRNRAKVQVELWKLVRELRNGRYYVDPTGFILSLENCRSGIFDSPEMTYVRDEGTMLRKLFGIFSLRPTIVSIMPLTTASGITVNFPLTSLSLQQVTTIPIVNLRIPLNVHGLKSGINIQDGLEQADSYVENKMIVTKMKSVIYSRDLICFYVNRRFQNINYAKLVSPYNFCSLPTTLTGFEALNETSVNYQPTLNVGDELFILRSAVMLEKSSFNKSCNDVSLYGKELIIGTSAGIVITENPDEGIFQSTHLLYDPLGASLKFERNGVFTTGSPITCVPEISVSNEIESFSDRVSKRGTIYVYVKSKRFSRCCQ